MAMHGLPQPAPSAQFPAHGSSKTLPQSSHRTLFLTQKTAFFRRSAHLGEFFSKSRSTRRPATWLRAADETDRRQPVGQPPVPDRPN